MRKALASLAIIVSACTANPGLGVSYDLARQRKADISDVRYELFFVIPENKDSAIRASETIHFNLARRRSVVLDFRQRADSDQDHMVFPARKLKRGENSISLEFTAGDQSLNRRDGFLYTLLVPDRARTLFPCFDQPDMKAEYKLTLSIPAHWTAVSNTYAETECIQDGRRTVSFAPTEPLSTYLFSFVAGEFSCDSIIRNGQPIHLYHRETDPEKAAQAKEILGMVSSSLDYLEEYTAIPYPFAKYDCIAIPDFQYGGMEHTGATLYNDRRLFLNASPTTDEKMERASLIAHETAHMWFGDLVTMKWFNDVWTKEVFANWFAAQMIRPLFPDTDYQLSDMKNYYASSYSEDRTPGSNAIQRPLDNLNNAGLIYCNIIYDKAPVVMEMLARRIGTDAYKRGIRRYLSEFAYSNADWDDLIKILSEESGTDLSEWSRVWIKEKGMPIFSHSIEGHRLCVTQHDPFGAGNIWKEPVSYCLVGRDSCRTVTLDFEGCEAVCETGFDITDVIPNNDGYAYGCFIIDTREASGLKDMFPSLKDPKCRMSVLMTLYENTIRGLIPAKGFAAWAAGQLPAEKDKLIRSSLLSYAASVATHSGDTEELESILMKISSDKAADTELRLISFRVLERIASSAECCGLLMKAWEEGSWSGMKLSENDITALSCQIMLRFPEKAAEIRGTQLSRIGNPDRNARFAFVSRACSADREERQELFNYLLTEEGRSNESWARTALSLLNHPIRQEEATGYIKPALEIIEDVQRQGDIFFPQSWCAALMGGHCSQEALEAAESFLEEHRDLNPLLATKILQNLPVVL